jgi:hypothetical protein
VHVSSPITKSHIPDALTDIPKIFFGNSAMTNMNLANNSLGVPNGWSGPDGDGEYKDPDGEYHDALPAGSSVGVIAIANAIPDMGAISQFTFDGAMSFITRPSPWRSP